MLQPPPRVNEGDGLNVSFSMSRNKENHRLMDVEFTYQFQQSSGKSLPPVISNFHIEWTDPDKAALKLCSLSTPQSMLLWLFVSKFQLSFFLYCSIPLMRTRLLGLAILGFSSSGFLLECTFLPVFWQQCVRKSFVTRR